MSDYGLTRLLGGVIQYKTAETGAAASPSGLIVMDHDHHEIHEGNHHFVSVSTAAASATDVLAVVLTSPATKLMNYTAEFSGSGAIIATIVENPTVAATSKVALVEYNNNRSSTKVAAMIAVKISSTDVSGGTTLQKIVLGGGQQGRTGGNAGDRNELMFKQSEDYAILIESNAASNNISYTGSWYEESS